MGSARWASVSAGCRDSGGGDWRCRRAWHNPGVYLKMPGAIDKATDALKQLVIDADNVITTWPAAQPGYLAQPRTTIYNG